MQVARKRRANSRRNFSIKLIPFFGMGAGPKGEGMPREVSREVMDFGVFDPLQRSVVAEIVVAAAAVAVAEVEGKRDRVRRSLWSTWNTLRPSFHIPFAASERKDKNESIYIY